MEVGGKQLTSPTFKNLVVQTPEDGGVKIWDTFEIGLVLSILVVSPAKRVFVYWGLECVASLIVIFSMKIKLLPDLGSKCKWTEKRARFINHHICLDSQKWECVTFGQGLSSYRQINDY